MVAKIIIWAPDRDQGIAVMLRALEEVNIQGVTTNLEEQKRLIASKQFRSGRFTTDLYQKVCEQEK
jgi:acetyl-CoA carboxylase biotin carboxylase subunit